MQTRRELLKTTLFACAGLALPQHLLARTAMSFPSKRPPLANRHFTSTAVEDTIRAVKARIADPELAWLFENCYPNTLDTTVTFTEVGGKPDTFVITGDIPAMWLRDSSAQVWPYLPLVKKDVALQKLIRGVIHRQNRCILLDPYANAFFSDPKERSDWESDYTEMKPGVHERKWEIDSLCYPIRLAHGYWKTTGDTSPFDSEWEAAMDLVVKTFRDQQRKDGRGHYSFKRDGDKPAPDAPELFGTPIKPIGLICSRFRPSDDPTEFQFLIPSNFFAVSSLRQLAELLAKVRHNDKQAHEATALADEVEKALHLHAKQGDVYAYEIDGLGGVSLMDDANVPSLLAMPYLGACKVTDPAYQATRKLVWSKKNPWFFEGKYSGVGGPHIGNDYIWPMSLIMSGLTSTSEQEVAERIQTLKATHGGTGFMHESFHKDNPKDFTRHWFAWANTLFGELILHAAEKYPNVLKG